VTARRPSRTRVVWLVVIVAAAAALLLFRARILRAAGWALVREDPIAAADAIVVPQWAQDAGAIEGADLFRKGYGNVVVVFAAPADPAAEELARRGVRDPNGAVRLVGLLGALGVPRVEQISADNGGTDAEGSALAAWCDRRHAASIIVVSTRDHSRRVRRVVRRSLRGRHVAVIVRSTRYDPFDPDRWWQTRDGVRTELIELEKLLVEVVRHPLS
jgi:hypothetical protein